MSTETVVLIVLVLLLLGALPTWPHSSSWGYAPSGILALLVVVLLIWAVAEHRPLFRGSGSSLSDVVQDAGNDVKAIGRDAADSIRRTVD